MMTRLEWLEALSYLVTIFGLPLAIWLFLYEQRRERQNEEAAIYQQLSDQYAAFLKLLLDNADLQLLRKSGTKQELTEEQKERRSAIFSILISLFERAYILVYDERMNRQTARLWSAWEDYMHEWCRRDDFREALPELLPGEDPEFADHIQCIADGEVASAKAGGSPKPAIS